MAKNIVIFSDGTGQRSGEHFDENRTNVYKLYRACRVGPDSPIDPADQFAFYDPGVGTLSPSLGLLGAVGPALYNLVCRATGLGLTANVEQCWAAIVKVWEPGDRIFLVGFSRGAYTVRCVGAVLKWCGVPTAMPDGSPLRKDPATLRRLAHEAVEQVYLHVGGEKRGGAREAARLEQRRLLAERFRARWSSADAPPHFIGVFDTVATVGNLSSLIVACMTVAALAALAAAVLAALTPWSFPACLAGVVAATVAVGFVAWIRTHFKVAFGLPGHPWWTTAHFNPVRMRFYDTTLDTRVGWARHALAIDEFRKDFDRVVWGNVDQLRAVAPGEPEWLRQIWFAGNHADVGGGYAEAESRLSDAALAWMVEEATTIPDGLRVDRAVLATHPAADGMQHDESKRIPFRWGAKIVRRIPPDAPLDPLVLARMKLARVLQYDEQKPYRPANLAGHVDVG